MVCDPVVVEVAQQDAVRHQAAHADTIFVEQVPLEAELHEELLWNENGVGLRLDHRDPQRIRVAIGVQQLHAIVDRVRVPPPKSHTNTLTRHERAQRQPVPNDIADGIRLCHEFDGHANTKPLRLVASDDVELS